MKRTKDKIIEFITARKASINIFGDVVCPYCKANIITPIGMGLKSGSTKCLVCDRVFTMTEKLAKIGNEKSKGDLNDKN